jgi:Fungal specific transcription factor domain
MWIGMLFGILSLSVEFWKLANKPIFGILGEQALRDPQDAITNYREKTVQCLVLGNYTEPGPYTVETLLLYYISDHFRTSDASFGSWMVFGLIVRAAMRLGYHRDASHFPKISVFRGEIQRRLWHMIVHLDLINSLQIGLPRMIRDNSFDTQEPRNLLDEDFDEHTTQLPPSRTDEDLTSLVYMNAKHQITTVFGMIVDQSNSTNPISYDEVMRLDKLLHESHSQLPKLLRGLRVEDLNTGSPQDRLRKFSIDLQFQKARCVLHRKWFVPKKSTAIYPYPYSMKACLDSSMRIVQSQIIMFGETAPHRVLHQHKWRASSLINHDFLLAAMLLCLYLEYSLAAEDAEQANVETETGIRVQWARDDMLQALEGSYLIWEELSSKSREASKVAKALKSMLTRVRKPPASASKEIRQEAFKIAYTASVSAPGKSP